MSSRFTQLFEHSPDAMVIVDRTGHINDANKRAEALFGYGRDQMRGESISTLFPGQTVPLPNGSEPGERVGSHVDLVGSSTDLRQFPADVNIIPIQTQRGTAEVLSVRDITEEQRAQFVLELGLDVFESADHNLQSLLDHFIRAQEEERNRIAAGIHDDTIQILAAANLRLQQLRNRLDDPEERDILDKLAKTLHMALSRLRQLIFDLRPTSPEHGGLERALRAVLEQMQSDVDVRYQLDDRCTGSVPASISALIFRIAQEALINVRKHAKAKTVQLEFQEVCGGCLARIVDDGVGYSPADVEERPGHIGLSLMRERAVIAGGWCRIESTPGAGAMVEFWVPYNGLPTQPEAGSERAA